MNCISGLILASCLVAFSACGAPASETPDQATDASYALHYTITPNPDEHTAFVTLQLSQSHGQFREMSFSTKNIDTSSISADGVLHVAADQLRWRPGRLGGTLSWQIAVAEQRTRGGFDAWLDTDWGIFRAEDIIPRATTRALRTAASTTTFSFVLPDDWSAITQYKNDSGQFVVANPQRRFDQPSGWIAIGQLGVRRETIAGVRVAVAAPEGQSVHRMDMLALLNWTLPELNKILTQLPQRLTIVSASDPMWRGGLSAPASIYIHARRPLISENATSTLLHEVMHVALRIKTATGYDWIAEGLAEYYSLNLLHRGGAITTRRYKSALQQQSAWAEKADMLCAEVSGGATTALAVTVFRDLDKEIRAATNGLSALDDLTAQLADTNATVEIGLLRTLTAKLIGKPSDVLHSDKLPGCRSIAATTET